MNLRVERKILTSLSTIGELFINGVLECWTLELETRTDDVKPRAIPAGTYQLTRRWSPKHQRDVPHVENVPGFTDIEIHWGNFPKDTDGCLLVGRTKGPNPDFIGASKMAWVDLWEKLSPIWAAGQEITITYVDAPSSAGLQENLRKLGHSEEEAEGGFVEVK